MLGLSKCTALVEIDYAGPLRVQPNKVATDDMPGVHAKGTSYAASPCSSTVTGAAKPRSEVSRCVLWGTSERFKLKVGRVAFSIGAVAHSIMTSR